MIAQPSVAVAAVTELVSLLTTTTHVEAYPRRTCQLAAQALSPDAPPKLISDRRA